MSALLWWASCALAYVCVVMVLVRVLGMNKDSDERQAQRETRHMRAGTAWGEPL